MSLQYTPLELVSLSEDFVELYPINLFPESSPVKLAASMIDFDGPFPVEPEFPIGGPVGPFPVEPFNFPLRDSAAPLPEAPDSARASFLESNDTILDATFTGLSTSNPGIFEVFEAIGDKPNSLPGLDVDFFQVQLDEGSELLVDIDASVIGLSFDSILRVFDEFGNELAFSDDAPAPDESPTLDSFIEFTAPATGFYYVGVSGFSNSTYDPFVENSGSEGSTGDYALTIEVTASSEPSLPIFGTPLADRLFGGGGDDLIFGLGGDDEINGLGGNDRLFGGEGNDIVFGAGDDDFIDGGSGDDFLLDGGDGNDIVRGGDGNDFLFDDGDLANSNSDGLYGDNGNDFLVGGIGNDILDGGLGGDRLVGARQLFIGGNFGTGERDLLTGGAGRDTFVLTLFGISFYDDGDPLSAGEFDFALISDFNASEDTVELLGGSELYALEPFPSRLGINGTALVLDPGDTGGVGEVIAVFQDINASDIDLTSPAFNYV